MSLDALFVKKYDDAEYNCAHFVRDAWQEITGQDISDVMAGFVMPPGKRMPNRQFRQCCRPLNKPESPCLVLCYRINYGLHIGIFYNGRILHFTEGGASLMPPIMMTIRGGFTDIKYYSC